MRPEGSEAPVKAPRQPRREQNTSTEPRTERKPQAKRPQQTRPQSDRPQVKKPQSAKPQEQKIGGLGALLLQAGIKGSK